MRRLGRHQAPKATSPQFASLPTLPPGIQTDTIKGHCTDHLLQLHRGLPATAGLSASHAATLLRNTGFDPTAQSIVMLIGWITGLRTILGTPLAFLDPL